VRGESGWFGRDYGNSLKGVNVPVIGHEVGQWVAYPDFDVIKKFTGFMQPGNYDISATPPKRMDCSVGRAVPCLPLVRTRKTARTE